MGITSRDYIEKQHIPADKDEKLKQISRDTLNEVLEKLKIRRRVLVVRPTGFGKSYMLAGITSSKDEADNFRYNKCLYVYPTNVIKQDVINTYSSTGKDERAGMLRNTTFISYMRLSRLVNSYLKDKSTTLFINKVVDEIYEVGNGDKHSTKVEVNSKMLFRRWISQFDVIMLDECHKIGSDGFIRVWEEIDSIIKLKDTQTGRDVRLVGVTATPKRLDGVDIRDILGRKNEISKMTLNDCIERGLLQKFDYVYAIGDRENFLKTTIQDINRKRKATNNEPMAEYEENELVSRMNEIMSIPEILKDCIKSVHTGGNNYAKFVVFFRDKKHIEEMSDTVLNWFKQAFPGMKIEHNNVVTKLSSDELKYEIDDLDILDTIEEKPGVINLIFCVDKLNMGYHVESITGIVLLRETSSAIVYNQQIGRCFSVRSMNKPIIIDLIDKCNAGSLMDKHDRLKSGKISEGEKLELQDALDESNLEVKYYAKDFISHANRLRTQNYTEIYKETVKFLYFNRKAPYEVISSMTKISVDNIKKIIEGEQS